ITTHRSNVLGRFSYNFYQFNVRKLSNINGYYDKLIEFLKNCVKEGFIKESFVEMLIVSDDVDELIEKILSYKAPKNKWEI
ncbi:LOG family protein, partial [Aliarcobacter butzleri]|uniref:LOG family protein n=1 Tax=Aliarcobacter butzleri TaxID=28197 RepID=UPI0021B5E91A